MGGCTSAQPDNDVRRRPYTVTQHRDSMIRLERNTAMRSSKTGKPGPPEGIPAVTEITHNSISLSWLPPLDHGFSAIISYAIEISYAEDKHWRKVTESCQGTNFEVRNLYPGQKYRFRVRAQNVIGFGKTGEPTDLIVTQLPASSFHDESWDMFTDMHSPQIRKGSQINVSEKGLLTYQNKSRLTGSGSTDSLGSFMRTSYSSIGINSRRNRCDSQETLRNKSHESLNSQAGKNSQDSLDIKKQTVFNRSLDGNCSGGNGSIDRCSGGNGSIDRKGIYDSLAYRDLSFHERLALYRKRSAVSETTNSSSNFEHLRNNVDITSASDNSQGQCSNSESVKHIQSNCESMKHVPSSRDSITQDQSHHVSDTAFFLSPSKTCNDNQPSEFMISHNSPNDITLGSDCPHPPLDINKTAESASREKTWSLSRSLSRTKHVIDSGFMSTDTNSETTEERGHSDSEDSLNDILEDFDHILHSHSTFKY